MTDVVELKAVNDIAELKKSGNKATIAKIEWLLLELREHPTTGTGQVEALKALIPQHYYKYNFLST